MKNKRIQDVRFRIYSLCIFLLFAVTCFLLTQKADAAETVGMFTFVTGRVDILRNATLPSVSVKLHDPVMLKDVVRTKSDARAEITLKDNTIIRIAQRSRIDISEYVSIETTARASYSCREAWRRPLSTRARRSVSPPHRRPTNSRYGHRMQ